MSEPPAVETLSSLRERLIEKDAAYANSRHRRPLSTCAGLAESWGRGSRRARSETAGTGSNPFVMQSILRATVATLSLGAGQTPEPSRPLPMTEVEACRFEIANPH